MRSPIKFINKDHFLVDLIIDPCSSYNIFSLYLADEYLGKCSSVGERTSAAAIQTFYRNGQSLLPKYRTGDLMAHATNDLNAIQNVAGAGILTFADSVITGGTTIIAMICLLIGA